MSISIGKNNRHKESIVVVSKKVKSHADDAFFVKKTKAAEEFLRKHGLPPVYTK